MAALICLWRHPRRIEGGFDPRLLEEAKAKLQKAIAAAGVESPEENGAGIGVRFRKAVDRGSKNK
jgi:hypothetical protein